MKPFILHLCHSATLRTTVDSYVRSDTRLLPYDVVSIVWGVFIKRWRTHLIPWLWMNVTVEAAEEPCIYQMLNRETSLSRFAGKFELGIFKSRQHLQLHFIGTIIPINLLPVYLPISSSSVKSHRVKCVSSFLISLTHQLKQKTLTCVKFLVRLENEWNSADI